MFKRGLIRVSAGFLLLGVWGSEAVGLRAAGAERLIPVEQVGTVPTVFEGEAGPDRSYTWWFPKGVKVWTLPHSGGLRVDTSDARQVAVLKERRSYGLKELPLVGARYEGRTLAVFVPWPHYAAFVVGERCGIRFEFPTDRNQATPCRIVAQWTDEGTVALAQAFRTWRASAADIGGLPRPRSLRAKAKALPKVTQLYGAPHIYLWGPAGFSRHDVERRRWVAVARQIQAARLSSVTGRLRATFTDEAQGALKELAQADWPMNYLTVAVAGAIDRGLTQISLVGAGGTDLRERVARNRKALASELGSGVRPVEEWGDGLSLPLMNALDAAGIENAVLTLSDLYEPAVRPDVVAHAESLGYLVGPYDSYHSVHSPDAGPDDTWVTAQFDRKAFESGRVVKESGRRQGGFKGRGFHFSPEAAWPYVQERVGRLMGRNGYTSWFIDCDATGECFDDYSPHHPATQVDDMRWRRDRLRWLEGKWNVLVGSEGGSILFADVIHFGHGVHTPYIGHLAPEFRDRKSPHYLGRHWPPDSPEQSFKAVALPKKLKSPYFDPTLRVPLYQAVLGDELVATHHWSFDSLKLSDVAATRALLEILYGVPPMYHLNRETWATRRETVLKHVGFWGALHRVIAPLAMVGFEVLSQDRQVQRTQYGTGKQVVTVTVNFGSQTWNGLPGRSARVTGVASLQGRTYTAN